MSDKRTYRQCVRIVIIKGKEVLLGQKIINGSFICYEFPGGGIEDRDTKETTVVKEAMEEVGIKVKNVKHLNVSLKYEVDYPNPERAKLYKGGEDHFYMAEFEKKDSKLHGSENDKLPFTWETIDNAIKLIKDGPESKYNPARIEALEKVKELISGKKKSALENW